MSDEIPKGPKREKEHNNDIVKKEPFDFKKKIEALLFATQGLTVSKISEKLDSCDNETLRALDELKKDYESRDCAFTIADEGELWKLTVKSAHVPLVKDLIPSEFPKSLLETLAVIAWRNPANQSDIIKVRGNKAYDHIKALEDAGLISASPSGRSRELKLTEKFYDYFNARPEDVKKQFESKIKPASETKTPEEKPVQ